MKPGNFSIVENFMTPNKNCDLTKLINGIKGERMKSCIEPIRKTSIGG